MCQQSIRSIKNKKYAWMISGVSFLPIVKHSDNNLKDIWWKISCITIFFLHNEAFGQQISPPHSHKKKWSMQTSLKSLKHSWINKCASHLLNFFFKIQIIESVYFIKKYSWNRLVNYFFCANFWKRSHLIHIPVVLFWWPLHLGKL